MPCRVEKSHVIGGLVAEVFKKRDILVVDGSTIGTDAEGIDSAIVNHLNRIVEGLLGICGFSLEKCARHVAVIAGSRQTRKNVDDDKLVGTDAPRAPKMRTCGGTPTGNNCFLGDRTVLEANGLDLMAYAL